VPPRAGTSPAAEKQQLCRAEDQQMVGALQKLSVRQRQVLALRYWLQYSEQEPKRA
jgi:DNA-directed RNA polymerase specialized sigma24 family protein